MSLLALPEIIWVGCFLEPAHETEAQQWNEDREIKPGQINMPGGGEGDEDKDNSEFSSRLLGVI